MMTLSRSWNRRAIRGLAVVGITLVAAAPLAAQTHQGSAKLKWGPAPAVFPKGARMAVVNGDPTKSGPFTVALAFPAGYRIPPHFHPTDENVVVKSGTLLVGMGDKADRKAMKVMKKGESGSIKANMHHYAAARGKTRIEVSATGPFAMTYVNPTDDPTGKR
jgi:quercetin dioxygenase-like cupin family protein